MTRYSLNFKPQKILICRPNAPIQKTVMRLWNLKNFSSSYFEMKYDFLRTNFSQKNLRSLDESVSLQRNEFLVKSKVTAEIECSYVASLNYLIISQLSKVHQIIVDRRLNFLLFCNWLKTGHVV
jgi:hypothetical protein